MVQADTGTDGILDCEARPLSLRLSHLRRKQAGEHSLQSELESLDQEERDVVDEGVANDEDKAHRPCKSLKGSVVDGSSWVEDERSDADMLSSSKGGEWLLPMTRGTASIERP